MLKSPQRPKGGVRTKKTGRNRNGIYLGVFCLRCDRGGGLANPLGKIYIFFPAKGTMGGGLDLPGQKRESFHGKFSNSQMGFLRSFLRVTSPPREAIPREPNTCGIAALGCQATMDLPDGFF